MSFSKITFLFAMSMAMAIVIIASTSTDQEEPVIAPLRGSSRYLAGKSRGGPMTCNNYPRLCRVKGSPGPDCCKKKCVNVLIDKENCGKCGNKCRYYEICCKGKCVNPLWDKKNCGGCNNRCKKHTSCAYGMCNYA